MAQVRTRTSVYGLAAVDHRGRIADSTISEILRWIPGTRVSVTVSAGLVDVLANPDGTSAINRDGHFLLPAATRHQVGLRPGERVLLVVEPDEQSLAVYPPAVLDMILTRHGTLLAGGTDD